MENFKKKFDILQTDTKLDSSTKEVLSSLYDQYNSLCQQINIRSSTPDIQDLDSISPDADDLELCAKQTSRQVEVHPLVVTFLNTGLVSQRPAQCLPYVLCEFRALYR